jgi:acyl homoserine lactone synthase
MSRHLAVAGCSIFHIGRHLRQVAKRRALGSTLAVARYLESLARIRSAGVLQGPVLWGPVTLAEA